MVRLAVLEFHHETNTFSGVLADVDSYRGGGIRRGEAFADHYRDSQSTLGGFLATAPGQESVETVPLMDAMVTPRGPVTEDAYEVIVDEMMEMLAVAGPFDGVLLGLHGACVAAGHPSADVDIADRVRTAVGLGVPIGSVVDMHANLDPRLAATLDVLLAYQTNPHVDPRVKGEECRRLLLEMVATGDRPEIVLEQLPIVVTITQQDTSAAPMSELLEVARTVESELGMVDVSILEGFPYADVQQMGMSVLVTHPDRAVAEEAARRVAVAVWDRRADLQGGAVTIDEAVEIMREHRGDRPLLVLDVGDNIGGGGPGDSTVLLAAVLDGGIDAVAGTLYDPAVVAVLASVPVGAPVEVLVGGRSNEQTGKPIRVSGTLTGRHSGRFETGHIAHGGFKYFDGGDMVAITTDQGVSIVLTSKSVQSVTPAQLEVVGLVPSSFRAIIGKGVNAPRAGYADVCGDLVVVDTPGVTMSSVQNFPYRNRRRPMYPFEPETRYP